MLFCKVMTSVLVNASDLSVRIQNVVAATMLGEYCIIHILSKLQRKGTKVTVVMEKAKNRILTEYLSITI